MISLGIVAAAGGVDPLIFMRFSKNFEVFETIFWYTYFKITFKKKFYNFSEIFALI